MGSGSIDPHFLNLGTSGQIHAPAPGERAHNAHWIGGVDPRATLEDMEKRKFFTLPGLERQTIIQPIGSCYTDCTTMAQHMCIKWRHSSTLNNFLG
jgi:hypothetical protein